MKWLINPCMHSLSPPPGSAAPVWSTHTSVKPVDVFVRKAGLSAPPSVVGTRMTVRVTYYSSPPNGVSCDGVDSVSCHQSSKEWSWHGQPCIRCNGQQNLGLSFVSRLIFFFKSFRQHGSRRDQKNNKENTQEWFSLHDGPIRQQTL